MERDINLVFLFNSLSESECLCKLYPYTSVPSEVDAYPWLSRNCSRVETLKDFYWENAMPRTCATGACGRCCSG